MNDDKKSGVDGGDFPVLGPRPDSYDVLVDKLGRQSIQLGRYRHALRVIAGLAKMTPACDNPSRVAIDALALYDDNK